MKKLVFIGVLLVTMISLGACSSSKAKSSETTLEGTKIGTEGVKDKVDNLDSVSKGSFVDDEKDSTFDGKTLKSKDFSYTFTKFEVLEVGEKGNEYGASPALKVTFDALLSPKAEEPYSPWLMVASTCKAYQDTDPNSVSELVMRNGDDKLNNNLKIGGEIKSVSCSYSLSDTKTPIKLVFGNNIIGDNVFGPFYLDIDTTSLKMD